MVNTYVFDSLYSSHLWNNKPTTPNLVENVAQNCSFDLTLFDLISADLILSVLKPPGVQASIFDACLKPVKMVGMAEMGASISLDEMRSFEVW